MDAADIFVYQNIKYPSIQKRVILFCMFVPPCPAARGKGKEDSGEGYRARRGILPGSKRENGLLQSLRTTYGK